MALTANEAPVNAYEFNYVVLESIYSVYYFYLFVHSIWISQLVYI